MTEIANLTIKVALDSTIELLTEENQLMSLRQQLSTLVNEFLVVSGIFGTANITTQRLSRSDRVIEIYVNGIRQPFSQSTMRRIWQAEMPTPLWDLPKSPAIYGFSDQWLRDYLNKLDLSQQDEVTRAYSYLAHLVMAALQEQPSCLIGNAQVSQYIQRAAQPFSSNAEAVTFVLKFLIDYGVAVSNTPLILRTIQQGEELGRSIEDTSEALLARLRLQQVELIVSPQDFTMLTGTTASQAIISVYHEMINAESRDLFKMMEEGLFWELGVYFPDLVWKINTDLAPGMVMFKFNERITPNLPLLPFDQILVNDTPERLKLCGVSAQPAINPANGSLCAITSINQKKRVEDLGLTTWTPLGYLILLLAIELRHRAAHLFTVDDTEYHLAQIRESFPVLIEQIVQRFSTENLTRVFRGLFAEGISLSDLRSILERLLHYDTIPVDGNKLIVFDDRLPISPDNRVFSSTSWISYREFVRTGLKRYISYSLTRNQSTLSVYLLDPDLEQWLVNDNVAWSRNAQELDDKRQLVRDAVRHEIANSLTWQPIILTSVEPRVALRAILSLEMPDVRVISFTELSSSINVLPLSRITTHFN